MEGGSELDQSSDSSKISTDLSFSDDDEIKDIKNSLAEAQKEEQPKQPVSMPTANAEKPSPPKPAIIETKNTTEP